MHRYSRILLKFTPYQLYGRIDTDQEENLEICRANTSGAEASLVLGFDMFVLSRCRILALPT
ncbi:hypothetical protein BH11CYA1_BH11CYA1_48940 [soil metagenome]